MSYNRSLLNFITKNLDKKPSKPRVPKNQWQHPGEITKVNSPNITMDGVSYPVVGVPDFGQPQMMYPDQQYNFPGASSVTEFPQMQKCGGSIKKYQTAGEVNTNPDSFIENAFEVFDPTGISSWDDIYRSYKKTGLSPETGLEIFGAIPMLGKLGKAGKLVSNVSKGLSLTARQARNANTTAKILKGIGKYGPNAGRATDAIQAVATPPTTPQGIYNSVRPSDYWDESNYLRYMFGVKRDMKDDPRSEEAFREYLGLNKKNKYLSPADYKPSTSKDPNAKYYKVDKDLENDLFESFKDQLKLNENKAVDEFQVVNNLPYSEKMDDKGLYYEDDNSYHINEYDQKRKRSKMTSRARMLGQFTVGRGKDDKGEYMSYYDKYDFPQTVQNQFQGKPYEIYGRVYYPKKQTGGQTYNVKPGEYLSQIAKAHNISVEDLVLANQINNPNLIKPNQQLVIPEATRPYANPGAGGFQGFEQLQRTQEALSKLPNDQMVKEYRKQFNVPGNYAMVDKKTGTMSIFDQSGKQLKSFPVGTGKVIGDEYTINTKGPNKRNSTPAGIFTLTNKGTGRDTYAPKYGNNIWEMIDHNGVQQATALHQVPTDMQFRNALIGDTDPSNNRISNGCINCRKKDFDTGVEKYLGKNSQVYILPEDENNYFKVRNNKLVLTGNEYNPNVLYSKKDLNARPLQIKYAKSQFPETQDNVQKMAQSLVDQKQKLMKDLKIDNDTYNELAQLTLGIAGQESNYGDNWKYKYKESAIGQSDVTDAKRIKNLMTLKNPFDISPNSRGFTQIKYDSQNKDVRNLFSKYGINSPNDLADPSKSNVAALIMLGYMSNNELPQLKDKMNKLNLSKSDALLYLNQGKKGQITNMTATPEKNKYIRSVKDYSKRFVLNQKEQGGPVMGQEMEVSPDEMEQLRKQGYKFKVVK